MVKNPRSGGKVLAGAGPGAYGKGPGRSVRRGKRGRGSKPDPRGGGTIYVGSKGPG